ncbi:MAG TPA: HEAT repeat domain-containing protein, partial [Kofleriaceae bacterium]|nr:HEAT repeat domain-containing protein [Kofleriaceae bacterium]
DDSANQLRGSRDYKIRLSAALHLAKQQGDRRAVKALGRALMLDSESTVRRVAALSLGALLTPGLPEDARKLGLKALEQSAQTDGDKRVRASAGSALLRARAQLGSLAQTGGGGGGRGRLFVHVGKPSDRTGKLPSGSVEMVQAAVRGALRRNAPDYQMSSGSPPTRSELASRRLRGYYVGAAVAKVAIESSGGATEVRCTVSLRVSPWTGRDGNERLVANESATASGSGRVQTSAGDSNRAAADCAVAVSEELTARQVVPFLRRVAAAN